MTATALVLASSVLASCSPSGQSEAAGSPSCPQGGIQFGIEPFEDPGKLEPAYKELALALEKKLDCPVEVRIVEDYAAEVLALQNGELHLAQFGPIGYVFASDRAGAEPVASFGTADGQLSSYTAGIWVPKDSAINSVEDLSGHSLALGSVGSTSGDILPSYALRKAGLGDGDIRADYAGGHPEAMLALVNGVADAAEINSQTLATATAAGTFDQSKYREIWTSEPIPNDPITVSATMPQAFKDAVSDALLSLPPETVGKVGAFLDVSPPGKLIEVSEGDYAWLFDLAKTMGLTEKDV